MGAEADFRRRMAAVCKRLKIELEIGPDGLPVGGLQDRLLAALLKTQPEFKSFRIRRRKPKPKPKRKVEPVVASVMMDMMR